MKAIKILLGIIAVNLTLITLIQLKVFPTKASLSEIAAQETREFTVLEASETKQLLKQLLNYCLLNQNEDGSININLVDSSSIYIKGLIWDGKLEKFGNKAELYGVPVNLIQDVAE